MITARWLTHAALAAAAPRLVVVIACAAEADGRKGASACAAQCAELATLLLLDLDHGGSVAQPAALDAMLHAPWVSELLSSTPPRADSAAEGQTLATRETLVCALAVACDRVAPMVLLPPVRSEFARASPGGDVGRMSETTRAPTPSDTGSISRVVAHGSAPRVGRRRVRLGRRGRLLAFLWRDARATAGALGRRRTMDTGAAALVGGRARARPKRAFPEDVAATQLATRIVEACLPCVYGPGHVVDESGTRDSSGGATVGALGALASSGAPSGSAIVALLARVCEVMCSLLRTSTSLCPIPRDPGCHAPADPRALQVLHSDDTTQPRNAYPSALTLSPRWVEARTRCAGVRVSLLPSRAGLLSGPAFLTECRCAPTPRSLSKVLETLVAVGLRSSVVPNVGVRMQLLHTLCQPWAVGALERRRGVADAPGGGSVELVRLLELELSADIPERRPDGAPSQTLWRRMTSGRSAKGGGDGVALAQANAAAAFAEASSSRARSEIATGLLEQIALTSQSADVARAALDALASARDRASAGAEGDSEALAWGDLKQSVSPRLE